MSDSPRGGWLLYQWALARCLMVSLRKIPESNSPNQLGARVFSLGTSVETRCNPGGCVSAGPPGVRRGLWRQESCPTGAGPAGVPQCWDVASGTGELLMVTRLGPHWLRLSSGRSMGDTDVREAEVTLPQLLQGEWRAELLWMECSGTDTRGLRTCAVWQGAMEGVGDAALRTRDGGGR